MFANQTQTPMQIENLEFRLTLNKKSFTDENKSFPASNLSLIGVFFQTSCFPRHRIIINSFTNYIMN